MLEYGDPQAKPEDFYYFLTRKRLRLPARRIVKQCAMWQGKPMLKVIEGFEKKRFTRLEFSNYAIAGVDKALLRLHGKPNLDVWFARLGYSLPP